MQTPDLVMLAAATGPISTTALSQGLSVTPATASSHATVLASAGLTSKTRQGGTVLHHITPLGQSLCDAATAQ